MALVKMQLSRIIIQETVQEQIIVLKECHGNRSFPIVIGINEAFAIDRRLKGHEVRRPLTHDLLYNVIGEMGGKLDKIVINDLRDGTFFARLMIRRDNKVIELDSRPSDAIALGAINEMPIFVAEHVLAEVCNS